MTRKDLAIGEGASVLAGVGLALVWYAGYLDNIVLSIPAMFMTLIAAYFDGYRMAKRRMEP